MGKLDGALPNRLEGLLTAPSRATRREAGDALAIARPNTYWATSWPTRLIALTSTPRRWGARPRPCTSQSPPCTWP